MQTNIPLLPNNYYHIFNCGIDGIPLFNVNDDYEHFLRLYERYVEPVADTFAWCLMGNHFHLLLKIKKDIIYRYSSADEIDNDEKFNDIKWQTIDPTSFSSLQKGENFYLKQSDKHIGKIPKPHQHFAHLFNAYAKAFNKKYKRHGALFESPFKRKLIDSDEYLKKLIIYIHQNPVHHGFCDHPIEYPWSSYSSCISIKPESSAKKIIRWFDDKANFIYMHEDKLEIEPIEKWLEISH